MFQTSFAQVETEGQDTRFYHGPSASLYRPNASIHSPLTDGIITDWSAISRNLNYCFQESLRLSKDLSDHPLLVTEPAWNTKEAKEGMCELAFEEFGVQAYYGVDRAVMSAFASGKGTALVLDVGHSSTSVVPIYDGFVLKKGT